MLLITSERLVQNRVYIHGVQEKNPKFLTVTYSTKTWMILIANLVRNYVPTFIGIGPLCRTYDKNIWLTFSWTRCISVAGMHPNLKLILYQWPNGVLWRLWRYIRFDISDTEKSVAQRTVRS